MWSAIKHSLNNTLGTFKDTPLDKIVSGKSYEAFYEFRCDKKCNCGSIL